MTVSFAAALAASSYLRQRAGYVNVMPRDHHNRTEAELVNLVPSEARTEHVRVGQAMEDGKVEQAVRSYFKRSPRV